MADFTGNPNGSENKKSFNPDELSRKVSEQIDSDNQPGSRRYRRDTG
ncbi:MAG: hypothetical protein OER87_11605 [Gammaproteobacteria bacterium]|nr:hypothetical protein [Gammaproteobacteria bacterium]